jgi:SET family sugar efflux transporter-like MFS transporter
VRSTTVRVSVTTFLLGLQQALLIPVLSLYATRILHLGPLGLLTFLVLFHGTGLIVSLALPAVLDKRGNGAFWFSSLTVLAIVGYGAFALPLGAGAALLLAALTVGPASAQNSVYFAALKTTGASRSSLLSTRGLFTVAWVVGPLVGAVLQTAIGFRGVFAVLAVVNVVVLAAAPRWGRQVSAETVTPEGSARSAVSKRSVALGFAALVCLYGTNVIATTTMPLIVTALPGGSTTISGTAFAASAALEAVVLFALARWTTGRNEALLILWGCVPGAAYYVILASTATPWAVVPAQALNAVFISTAVGLGMTWFQSLWTARQGLATGLFMNASRIASLATAPLIGVTAGWTHSYQTVNWLALALLVPACAILAALRKAASPASQNHPRTPA